MSSCIFLNKGVTCVIFSVVPMNLIIQKTPILVGSLAPPSSKSHTIRALLLGLLSKGETVIENRLDSEDVSDAIRVVQTLGAGIIAKDSRITLKSSGIPLLSSSESLFLGNSGITAHFILPMLGLRKNAEWSMTVDCGNQMRARTMHSFIQVLNNLGMHISYVKEYGYLPISVSGELIGGSEEVQGITSQYISSLLLALPCAKKDSEIVVNNLHERPYVEMTLSWLRKQNIEYVHKVKKNSDIFLVKGNQRYSNFAATIPADFSSASYLMAASVLVPSEVNLWGIDMHDHQGDKRLISILQSMGADIMIESDKLTMFGGKPLRGMTIDANDIPDLVPTLAVIGTKALGCTQIMNVKNARLKETDRIISMCDGLTRMGARIEEREDGLMVYQSALKGANLRGYGDHRTVMALSIAGLLAEGVTVIDEAQSIDKTFPTFVSCMQSLGAKLEFKKDDL